MAENKNKEFNDTSRVYLWHRFEQTEADCYLKWLPKKGKLSSFRLLSTLIEIGTLAKTLTDKDISDMNAIVQEVSERIGEKVLDQS